MVAAEGSRYPGRGPRAQQVAHDVDVDNAAQESAGSVSASRPIGEVMPALLTSPVTGPS